MLLTGIGRVVGTSGTTSYEPTGVGGNIKHSMWTSLPSSTSPALTRQGLNSIFNKHNTLGALPSLCLFLTP